MTTAILASRWIVFTPNRLNYAIDNGIDAAIIIIGTKSGRHWRIARDDAAAFQIGEFPLQTIADFKTCLAVGNRHHKQHAVILTLLANSPFSVDIVGVVFDVVTLEALNDQDANFVRALGAIVENLLLKLLALLIVQYATEIGDW
jgi:hypothetical protein